MSDSLTLEMTEVKKDLHEMKSQMNEMYQALIGNKVLNDGGLVGRVHKIEEHMEKLEIRIESIESKSSKMEVYQKIMWSCLGAVSMAVFAYVVQYVIHK